LTGAPSRRIIYRLQDYELIAQELSNLAEKVSDLKERMAEVEKVNARLEEAALITSRALQEISGHWDAVYEAMRRKDTSQEPSTGLQRG
jgi:predicted nuclease with TOPRIM domain